MISSTSAAAYTWSVIDMVLLLGWKVDGVPVVVHFVGLVEGCITQIVQPFKGVEGLVHRMGST